MAPKVDSESNGWIGLSVGSVEASLTPCRPTNGRALTFFQAAARSTKVRARRPSHLEWPLGAGLSSSLFS